MKFLKDYDFELNYHPWIGKCCSICFE